MKNLVLGIDIGGANLKYASSCGAAAARDFAMWLTPEQLSQTLIEDLQNNFCTRFNSIGSDLVYMIEGQEGRPLTIPATPEGGWDLSLYLLTESVHQILRMSHLNPKYRRSSQ